MSAELRKRAVKLLARREHTRRELEAKLSADGGEPGDIGVLLDELQKCSWLSESRVAEQLVHSRKSRYGARRIERDLRDRGVPAETVSAALAGLKEGELERARVVWQRKFKEPPTNAAERARHVRFLQGRGFELGVIFRVIAGDSDEK